MFEVNSWTYRISDGSYLPRPVTGLTDPGTGRVPTSLHYVSLGGDIKDGGLPKES